MAFSYPKSQNPEATLGTPLLVLIQALGKVKLFSLHELINNKAE